MVDRPDIGIAIDTDSPSSAISWPAIIAGALVATAISLVLIVLGTGLGFSMVSPWAAASASATTVAVSTVIWLVIMQWVSAGVGGYLAGRLRTRWTDASSDEVFFRDTAHGFLVWALSTIIVAALTTSALSGLVSTGARVAGAVADTAAQEASKSAGESAADPTAYFVDRLLRPAAVDEEPVAPPDTAAQPEPATPPPAAAPDTPSDRPSGPATPQILTTPTRQPASPNETEAPSATMTPASSREELRGEVTRILVRGMASEEFPPDDRQYLVQLVTAETGIPEMEAEERVDAVIQDLNNAAAETQRLAEEAREAAATLAVVIFVSLLVGAFIGCVAAALGGGERDEQSRTVLIP